MSGTFRKVMVFLGLRDEDEDGEYIDDYGYEDEPSMATMPPVDDSLPQRVKAVPGGDNGAAGGARQSQGRPRVADSVDVLSPGSFNDAKDIGDHLKAGSPVAILLDDCDHELRRRIVDFTSGLTFGLDGSMERVTEGLFLMTPVGVDVAPEERRRLRESGLHGSGVN